MVGAFGGGVSRGANAASQAGRKTDSNSGTSFLGSFCRVTGWVVLRNATIARKSSSAIPLKTGNGCTGNSRSPFGRRPRRMAVMIWSSVQPPIPVCLSGVMFDE